MFYAPLMLL